MRLFTRSAPRGRRRAAAWSCLTVGALLGLIACDELEADPITAPYVTPFSGIPDSGLTSSRTAPVQCPQYLQENRACSQAGSVCEYGSSPDQKCNTLFVCANDTSYGNYWTEQSNGSCEVCPKSEAIVEGAPCALTDGGGPEDELHCATSHGTCICTTGRDGAHAHDRKWVCAKPAAGCPEKRPMLGQPCFQNGVACDYGSCESKRGSQMICEDEVWQTEIAKCAN